MVKAVLADLALMNPARHIMLEEAFPEVRVPLPRAPTQVYKLVGQAKESGTFLCNEFDPDLFSVIPNVETGEYVYWYDRMEPS